jgi:hypothetical protein
VLLALVLSWVVVTWPHFRSALSFVALGKMAVLALLANLCYCAGYAMEGFIQPLVEQAYWRKLRWAVWTAGVLLAILLSNYWIADEIYPDFNQTQGAVMVSGRPGETPLRQAQGRLSREPAGCRRYNPNAF